MRGDETPGQIVTNFCTGVGVYDVISCADLYYDRLRGLGVARGQILAVSIDLLRRPYNTLALIRLRRVPRNSRLQDHVGLLFTSVVRYVFSAGSCTSGLLSEPLLRQAPTVSD